MNNIPSLAELREWGYRRGEAYACRLALAREVIRNARKQKWQGMSDEEYSDLASDCAAVRKVIRSSLRSIERWAISGFGDWVPK